jgi:hypothetical protein
MVMASSSSYAETVKEFQIITNNYSAEYRSAAGAIVSAVTKSGTNALHGSLFEFLRNDNLDAARWEFNKNARPGSKKPEFKRNQFGGSIGGPIIRDKTFFFASYEATRQNEGFLSLARVPDLNTRAGLLTITSRTGTRNPDGSCLPLEQVAINPIMPKFMALWPEPGKGNAIVPETGAARCDGTVQIGGQGHTETKDDSFAAKIDHQFANQVFGNLSGTYNFDTGIGGKQFGLLTPVNGTYTSSRKHVVAIHHNSILSNNMLNEFNFGYSWTKPHSEISTVDYDWSNYLFNPLRHSMGSLNPGDGVTTIGHAHSDSIWQQGSMTFKEGMSLTYGNHSMRWGAEFNRNAITTFGAQDGYNGEYTFTTLRDFLANNPDGLNIQVQLGPDPVRHIHQLFVGTYFQDNYRILPSLTLNLGLRHEMATLPNERDGKLSNLVSFFDQDVTVGKFYTQATLKSFSPRFGFAWAPGNKKTSLRGGYGIFYEQPGLYHYRTPLETGAPFIQQTSVKAADLRQAGATLRFPDAFATQRNLLLGVRQIWTMEYNMKNTYMQRWSSRCSGRSELHGSYRRDIRVPAVSIFGCRWKTTSTSGARRMQPARPATPLVQLSPIPSRRNSGRRSAEPTDSIPYSAVASGFSIPLATASIMTALCRPKSAWALVCSSKRRIPTPSRSTTAPVSSEGTICRKTSEATRHGISSCGELCPARTCARIWFLTSAMTFQRSRRLASWVGS